MRANQDDINQIVTADGVIVRRRHPELAGALAWARRQGQLRSVLPGVYAPPESAGDLRVRIQALMLSEPDAVLTGVTAAQVSFWPDLAGDVVECAIRRHLPHPGFEFHHRKVPPELVAERAGLRFTVPALTALDLADSVGGNGIDQALRTRTATLDGLWEALRLTAQRKGNTSRRELLIDSRDEPWSEAERLAHRLLRAAQIKGWKSNHPVVLDGLLYYLDVAFPGIRLVLEIDGRLHEDDPDIFENDRLRQNHLVLEGWIVLRFTWRMLEEDPDGFVATVLAGILLATTR
ncbi:DUF559 domain-containing protein [uncultured Friedmanniella sp.]|uniref:DUF559 domain-containing protein n=1 Tax=uncultured Friedmanniella sp. TaxID=335381 RepID=UPI0035C99DE8